MVTNPLFAFLLAIVVLAIATILHEMAHLIYLSEKGIKTKLRFNKSIIVGSNEDYKNLTKKELFDCYAIGIAIGLIVILAFSDMFPDLVSLAILVAYLIGCKSDIKNIIRLFKKDGEQKTEVGRIGNNKAEISFVA